MFPEEKKGTMWKRKNTLSWGIKENYIKNYLLQFLNGRENEV
jgi:hypothetical protein